MEDYLRQCLDSLIIADDLMQQLEVLVINDGSKDQSSAIAHEYSRKHPSTIFVIDKENGNYGSCINRGLKEATGKFIKILDADDSFDSAALAEFINQLRDTNADLVITNFSVVDSEGRTQQEVKKLITPFILRRNKKDVLTELPEKIEKTLSIEFNEEENKLYLANLIQVNKELQEQLNYDNVDRIAILAMLTRLRQICCEPRIIYDNISNISSKLSGCLDLIRNFLGNNQKVLLFSSFTSVLDLIAKELEKESITYYQLTGDTKKEERHRLVNQFQNDDTTVFLISLKAGGTGLNLTAAEAVIHFDPWWNMSAQNQATDRAYRIGQENVVTVYKLVMKDSVEEKILELQNKKKNLADSFVENNEGSITTMSTNDIIELFKV